jgi:hypothetical protein
MVVASKAVTSLNKAPARDVVPLSDNIDIAAM